MRKSRETIPFGEKETHRNVESFCAVIRNSFNDTMIVYRYGACYGFYSILKHIFPAATAYFDDENSNHILTKIGGRYYDIDGECTDDLSKIKKLTPEDHVRASKWAYGQRLEWMIAKYNSSVLTRSKRAA